MAKDKKSFLLYIDWITSVEKLSDKEAGLLFKHILRYVNDQDPESPDRFIDIVFEPIKRQLKIDLKKWESIRERNKLNGSKGGRPKNPENPLGSLETQDNPDEPKKAVTVTVIDIVKEENILNLYDSLLPLFPKNTIPKTDKQKKTWLECIRKLIDIDEYTIKQISYAVKWAREDEFWKGKFLSLLKLRKKNKEDILWMTVFAEQIKSNKPKSEQRPMSYGKFNIRQQ